LLLAGALAYYALLSIVPLLILTVIALSHVIDQTELLQTLGRYLEWLIPGQSGVLIVELSNFLDHREVMGWVLLVTMLFFSSLAFTVLENAMSVILHHRVAIRRRRFLVSAVIPYCYILLLGLGLLLVTLVAGGLKAMGQEQVEFLGRNWSLGGMSGMLLYLLGVAGEIFILTSIYFATLSQVGTVYGSLTTAIVVLLSFELASTLLMFGAQVIAEYERIGRALSPALPEPMRLDKR
jgi:uncharacterized BrkB/YihY/UPF0761 family membrane protein